MEKLTPYYERVRIKLRQDIRTLFMQGTTTPIIAEKLGISRKTVSTYLAMIRKETKSSYIDMKALKRKYETGRYTQAQLAEIFHVSESKISYLLTKIYQTK